jgi:hypothetical protein
LVEEIRVVNSVTGGEKGQKPERHELVPVEPMDEVARVYGFGCGKYAKNNWRLGYDWGLSYGAARRHLNAFWRGEDLDPESGLHHLAHGVFHLLTLMEYGRTHPELDDRYIIGAVVTDQQTKDEAKTIFDNEDMDEDFDVEEYFEDDFDDDDEDDYDDIIRAKWCFDGATTLEEAATMLEDYAAHLREAGKKGFLLRNAIEDDYGFVYHPDGQKLYPQV